MSTAAQGGVIGQRVRDRFPPGEERDRAGHPEAACFQVVGSTARLRRNLAAGGGAPYLPRYAAQGLQPAWHRSHRVAEDGVKAKGAEEQVRFRRCWTAKKDSPTTRGFRSFNMRASSSDRRAATGNVFGIVATHDLRGRVGSATYAHRARRTREIGCASAAARRPGSCVEIMQESVSSRHGRLPGWCSQMSFSNGIAKLLNARGGGGRFHNPQVDRPTRSCAGLLSISGTAALMPAAMRGP